MTTTTTGTGTITLGSAVSGYLTFALAGVANADVIDYAIKDGANSEHGTGTYTSSGTTLTRTVTKSTNANAAINLSGSAEVFISPRAETLNDASLITTGTMASARLGSGGAGAGAKYLADDQTFKTLSADGLASVVHYSSTQTITIPTGATRAYIKMWGGGAGSGGSNSASISVSGGAGAGGYLEKYLTGLTPGNTLAYTQGAAGAAGTSTTDGTSGGNSVLASGTHSITTLTASGGTRSLRSNGTASAGGAGGSATNGDLNIAGEAGQGGFYTVNSALAVDTTNAGGAGGRGVMGWGGRGVGGSQGGNAGTPGGCIIEWYY